MPPPASLLDLTAEELIARGIAPIRKEFRLPAITYMRKPPPLAAAAAAAEAPTADDALEAAGPAAAADGGGGVDSNTSAAAAMVAADGEGGHKRKSKRQRRKEGGGGGQHAPRMCTSFMLGACGYGDACRFSHDREAYLAAKPPDLPGSCPFSTSSCPYGLGCRWASAHGSSSSMDAAGGSGNTPAAAAAGGGDGGDSLQQQQQQQPQEGAGSEGKPAATAAAAGTAATTTATTIASSSRAQQEAGLVPACVPMAAAACIQPPINSISKGLQQQLWKRKYAFNRATQAVAAIRQQLSGAAGGGGGGVKGAKQQKRQQQHHQQEEAAAKRQRLDQTAAEAAAATAALPEPSAAAAPPEPSAAAAPPEPSAAAAASTVAAAAAGSNDDASVCDELDGLYEADDVPVTPHNSLVTQLPSAPQPAATTAAAAGTGAGSGPAEGQVVSGDAALIAALKSEQQQQQQRVGLCAADPSSAAAAAEPRSRPKFDIAGKTYLAPLTTVGNLPFRRVCVNLGCEVTCGEMALASNLLSGQASEWALLKRHPSEKFFGVQICGGYADQMANVAQLLDDTLGDGIDFVDINCGCPIDVICNKGAGSSLLLKPRRLEEVVRGVTSCINRPVIVKIRKGYYDRADVAHELIPLMPAWGAAAVTLHGRTRQQRYSRAADWDYIRRCARIASSVGLPLVGNGDVFSPSEWQQRLAAATAEPEDDGVEGSSRGDSLSGGFGVATAMIGRAALIKPWLFTEIHENRLWDISASERLDIIRDFASHGLEAWGSDSRGVETTRKFLLEWLSFTHRYIPVGLLEVVPQVMAWRPPAYTTRSQLEGLLASEAASDWVKITELFLGPAPPGFTFVPKHKSNAYMLTADALAQMFGARSGGGEGGEAGGGEVQQQPEEEEEGEENG